MQFHTPPFMVWEMDGLEFLADMSIIAEDNKKSNGPIISKEAVMNVGALMEQINGGQRNPSGNSSG